MAHAPDVALARARYARLAADYDELRLLSGAQESLRRRAVTRLLLRPGEVVLDVGCGTGASFELLQNGVEEAGRIIGCDSSPAMLDRARSRLARHGWKNTVVLEATAQTANFPCTADAALFFFTHDILRTPAALTNVLGALKPGGRVVAAGCKRAPWWNLPFNLALWLTARRHVTTFEGAARPWDRLATYLTDFSVESAFLGLGYMACGTRP
jgi:ubiquinone/menaquinone biosynthesis C-methylase UbiE